MRVCGVVSRNFELNLLPLDRIRRYIGGVRASSTKSCIDWSRTNIHTIHNNSSPQQRQQQQCAEFQRLLLQLEHRCPVQYCSNSLPDWKHKNHNDDKQTNKQPSLVRLIFATYRIPWNSSISARSLTTNHFQSQRVPFHSDCYKSHKHTHKHTFSPRCHRLREFRRQCCHQSLAPSPLSFALQSVWCPAIWCRNAKHPHSSFQPKHIRVSCKICVKVKQVSQWIYLRYLVRNAGTVTKNYSHATRMHFSTYHRECSDIIREIYIYAKDKRLLLPLSSISSILCKQSGWQVRKLST